MSSEWPLWEVFIRSQHGLAHKHVGSLHAPDAEMAIKNARDVYTRRNEGVSIWVVRSADIARVVAGRPGRAVRAGERQGLPASDVLPDARRSEAHLGRDVETHSQAPRGRLAADVDCSTTCCASPTTALVLAQRLGEWVGKGPVLEEDIASTNVGLDLLGQARLWLAYAGEVEARDAPPGRNEDAARVPPRQRRVPQPAARRAAERQLRRHDRAPVPVRPVACAAAAAR